jgi:hypothetical protein
MEDSLFAMVFERSQNFTTFLTNQLLRCKKEDMDSFHVLQQHPDG